MFSLKILLWILLVFYTINILVKIIYIKFYSIISDKIKFKSKFSNRSFVIFGTRQLGIRALNELTFVTKIKKSHISFIHFDKNQEGVLVKGYALYYGLEELKILAQTAIRPVVILADEQLTVEDKRKIIDECLRLKLKVKICDPFFKIGGKEKRKAIRKVKIEDYFEGKEELFNTEKIKASLESKVILVTGAGGSIGREICLQLMSFSPQKIVMLDQSESSLFEIEQMMLEMGDSTHFESIIGDIRDRSKMNELFSQFQPDLVFHTAAYKHVTLMEKHPEESIKVNVLGTKILAEIAILFHVEKFIFVSTDKAVNPSSVMGASKKLSEIYLQALNKFSGNSTSNFHTRFIITRFGNVVGSSGSVIPVFRNHITQNKDLMVTDKEVSRFFMTIKQACQLVLEASLMGSGGEIFIFEMGPSFGILDIAKKMILLEVKEKAIKLNIIFGNLRQGEKLHEELTLITDLIKDTSHPQIKIIQTYEVVNFMNINSKIEELEYFLKNGLNSRKGNCIKTKLFEIVDDLQSLNHLENHFLKKN